MELLELYRRIESGELDPTISRGPVNFYCREDEYGILIPPQPAADHYTSQLKNTFYPQSPRGVDWTHTHDEGVERSMTNGWIVSAPVEFFVHSANTPAPVPETDFRPSVITNYCAERGLQTPNSIFHLNTRWVVDVPDGYSVLCVSPCNYVESRFSVFPLVIDADEFPIELRVPLLIHNEEFTVSPGDPVVQLLPFKRSDYTVPATTGVFDNPPENIEKRERLNTAARNQTHD